MILVHVKCKSALPCAVEHASVAVEFVLPVLNSFDIKVVVELFRQAVLLLKVICDTWLLPEENIFADVAGGGASLSLVLFKGKLVDKSQATSSAVEFAPMLSPVCLHLALG